MMPASIRRRKPLTNISEQPYRPCRSGQARGPPGRPGTGFQDAPVVGAVAVAHDQRLAMASPSEPMPICSVPPSTTRLLACRPMA
jgi:hypothetical protein